MKRNKYEIFFHIVIPFLLILVSISASAQEKLNEPPSSGGAFVLTKNVVAGGGQTAQNSQMSARSTTGQTIAGNASVGNQFSLYSGFWTPDDFSPTAATISLGGRATSASGRGIRNAVITLTFPNGETRSTVTGVFGFYSFRDIDAGATYIISVLSKRFAFSPAAQIVTAVQSRDDLDFVADN